MCGFVVVVVIVVLFVFFLKVGRKCSKLNSGKECQIKNSLFQKLNFLQGLTAGLGETNFFD